MKNILIIAKKELLGYFNSATAYVVMVAFLLLWQFLFFRGVFLVGQTSLASLFDVLPWIFLLFVPALTMGTIAQEKSQGTLEFLLTRPIKEAELLAGKFLGSLTFVAISLLFMFPIAWSFDKFGNLDWGVVFGQYLASIFMAMVFVSLGIFISSIFKSQISAMLTTAIASFFLVIIGFDIATSRLPLALVPYFEYTSVLSHFSSISRGVIDVRDVWYFLSAVAVFLCIAYIILLKSKFGTWKRIESNTKIGIVLLIAIALISNFGISRMPLRADLTQEKIYTLSDSTKEILAELNDIVDVTFYRSAQLPSQFQPVLRQVNDTLKDYETFSGGNIVVTEKNPSDDEEIAREALSSGVQEMRFNVVSQEEFQIKTGYMGITISYGGQHESIPFVQNTNDLEYQLTSFIRKLTRDDKPQIVFVEGHGGKSAQTDYGIFYNELSKEYKIQIISIPAPAENDPETEDVYQEIEPAQPLEIPQETTVLVIAGPNKEIDQDSRKKIKEFAANGGSVLYLLDTIETMPQTLSANPNKNSFADFLKEEYGVSVEENLVYDLRSNETVSFSSGGMQYFLPYPFWVKTMRPEQSQIATEVESVVLPWASSIKIDDSKINQSQLEIVKLLSTTETGFTQSGQFNLSPEQSFPKKGLSQQLIALAAKSSDDSAQATRFAVVGDSDFLLDNFTQNNPQNLGFGIDLLSWLAQEESVTSIRLKNIADRTMTFENENQPNMIKYGNMAFAFLLPAGYGTLRLAQRKKKKQLEYGQK